MDPAIRYTFRSNTANKIIIFLLEFFTTYIQESMQLPGILNQEKHDAKQDTRPVSARVIINSKALYPVHIVQLE